MSKKCREPYRDTYGDDSTEAYSNLVLLLGKLLIKAHATEMIKEFIFSVLACDIGIKDVDAVIRSLVRDAIAHYSLHCLMLLLAFGKGPIKF